MLRFLSWCGLVLLAAVFIAFAVCYPPQAVIATAGSYVVVRLFG